MVGASSNIYVSATRGETSREESDEHVYRRTQHTWLISVEPHKHSLSLSRHKDGPIHYYAIRPDGDDSYQVQTHKANGLIGTILVKEGAHGDAHHLQEALAAGLKSASTESSSSESSPDAESDRWLRKALHVLQSHKFTDEFNVADFMTFAHGYMADRLDDRDAPARVAYPGLHKNPEEKKSKHGFWLTFPTKAPNSGGKDSESRLYGGLM